MRTALDAIFRPRTVAVVGASRNPEALGTRILANLVSGGFTGTVYPVNPKYEAVHAIACAPRVSAIPGPVDLAVIVVPAKHALAVVEDCVQKGVRGIVMITAGFKEIGAPGAALEAELGAKLNRAGMRLVGPNCMGVINTAPDVSMDATFAPNRPRAGSVGFISQSGALGVTLLAYADELDLGVAQFASIGNKLNISSNDLLEYWEDDPRVRLVLLYLENFGNPHKFAAIARRVSKKKPVIAVKSGRSSAGARAALSHTGGLAEVDVTADALFEQCGVLRVDTIDALFDVALAFDTQPLPKGARVGIITDAGGPAILAADACAAAGLDVAQPAPETLAALAEALDPNCGIGNPVDLIASGGPPEYRLALTQFLGDPGLDAVIVICVPPTPAEAPAIARAVREIACTADKPVLACFMADETVLASMASPHGAGGTDCADGRRVPVYKFPESCVRALAAMVHYAGWRARPEQPALVVSGVDRGAARGVIEAARATGARSLSARAVPKLLEAYGFPLAAAALAATPDEAEGAAHSLGAERVALKYVTPAIPHKTDLGLVALDLAPGAVAAAGRRMLVSLEAARGEVPPGEFLVQEFVARDDAVELILGSTHDPHFGPVIMFGLGGVFVEVLRDVAFGLPPFGHDDAERLIRSIRGAPILEGVRGRPGIDMERLIELIARLAQLAIDVPEIAELDLNPLLAFPKAEDFRVLDARVMLRDAARPRRHAPTRFHLRPTPAP